LRLVFHTLPYRWELITTVLDGQGEDGKESGIKGREDYSPESCSNYPAEVSENEEEFADEYQTTCCAWEGSSHSFHQSRDERIKVPRCKLG